MRTRSLAVVSAGLGEPSSTRLLADRLAGATATALRRQGVAVEVAAVELREHAHDLTNNLLTSFASEDLDRVKSTVTHADGVIAVTPIFSASYSGLFKTFFDVLDEGALAGTPVVIGATAGTARHSLALEHAIRPLFSYLKAVVVPTAVFAAAEDWATGGRTDDRLTSRIERAGRELAALVAEREPRRRVDPFEEPVPFEQLLGN